MAYLLAAIALFCAIFYLQARAFDRERQEWLVERNRIDLTNAKERGELLNRIQKPEMAGLPEVEVRKQYASIDDDEDLWEAHEEMGQLSG